MMRWPIVVEYESGRSDKILTGPADVLAFEREFDKPASAIGSGRITYFWWLAWHASKRQGKTDLAFEEWSETIAVIKDGDPKEADVLPLDLDPATGS